MSSVSQSVARRWDLLSILAILLPLAAIAAATLPPVAGLLALASLPIAMKQKESKTRKISLTLAVSVCVFLAAFYLFVLPLGAEIVV